LCIVYNGYVGLLVNLKAMIKHLTDASKKMGIKCNSWNRFPYKTDVVADVTCKLCAGKRAPNRSQGVDVSKMDLVGKIIHSSWGYNMTHNEFWLIEKVSNKSVEAVKIGAVVTEGSGGYTGEEKPDPTSRLDATNYKAPTIIDANGNEKHPREEIRSRFLVKAYDWTPDTPMDRLYFKGGDLTDLNLGYTICDPNRSYYFNYMD